MGAGGDGSGVVIRGYEKDDAAGIARLFYETVHTVNRADYSPEQVRAWAPEPPDPRVWHERMSGRFTLVAEERGEVIAFAELEVYGEGVGCLDMLYCRRDAVGRGVGSRLYRAIEVEARDLGLAMISTEASITARHFFEFRGFVVLREQEVIRGGVGLTNYVMQKHLEPRIGALCIMPDVSDDPGPTRGVRRCS